MILVGMIGLWGGYGLASWGYCLVRGWDIPLRSWFSPLRPYQWPKSGDPQLVPATRIFPAPAPAQQASGKPARRQA